MRCSIAELFASGGILEADEAVAITQQLIAALRDGRETDEVQPPHGPPTVDNVVLKDDGSVFCRGCQVTPAVSEIGNFLDSLLTKGSPRVPAGLRYTIARALLNVDVAPFGSLDELSADLARHERGDRVELVRRVLARSEAVATVTAAPSVHLLTPRGGRGGTVDRRRHHETVTDLRRALREADKRLFEQQWLLPPPAVIDLVPSSEPALRDRTRLAAAACLAAGLVLIGTGELMHRNQAPSVATLNAPLVVPAPAPEEERIALTPAVASSARGIIAVRDVPTGRALAPRPQDRRISSKGVTPSPVKTARRPSGSRRADVAQNKPPRRGVLDRLRLGWLRKPFVAN